MRISWILAVVLLNFAGRGLPAAENARPEPPIPDVPGLAAVYQRLPRQIDVEDPKLREWVQALYRHCVIGAVRRPCPPSRPNKWFAGGGNYNAQWIWDAMFVATAYAPLDDDQTIRDVFENYWYTIDHNPDAPKGSFRYGMVPCQLDRWPPAGFSQIPLAAWGCRMVWNQTHDRALVERCLPYLLAFDHWYSTERDVNGNGLIEFGAYKAEDKQDIVQTARYESFDFHPPLDNMKMTPHPQRPGGGAWYGNVEGVDATCFLLMSEEAIVDLAEVLGKKELAQRYRRIVAWRSKAVREKMWDAKRRFFYSLDRDTQAKIPSRTIQGFLTLTCGAADREQAAALVEQLQDPKSWWAAYPVPTVAMDDPKFGANAMWRGDMWPATTYLVACGLNRYGYYDVARQLAQRMRKLIAERGPNERYNPQTGRPIGDPGVAMTCSAWTLLVQSLYGVQDDFRTIVVPPHAKGRRLRLGKLQVSYPQDGAVELRSAFDRRFRVIFPEQPSLQTVEVQCDGQALKPGAVRLDGGAVSFLAEAGHTYTVRR